MAISTKKGDSGTTSLFDGTPIEKSNTYIECLGLCDELTVALGSVRLFLVDIATHHSDIENKDTYSAEESSIYLKIVQDIEVIQQNIFYLGANVASKFSGQYIVGDIDNDMKLIDDIEILAIKAGVSIAGDALHLNQLLSNVEYSLCELSTQIMLLDKVDAKSLKYVYNLLDALHRNGISSNRSLIPDTRTIITDIVNTLDELKHDLVTDEDTLKLLGVKLELEKDIHDSLVSSINHGLIVFSAVADLILDSDSFDVDIKSVVWADEVTAFDGLSEHLNKDFTLTEFIYPSENWVSYKFDKARVDIRKLERILTKMKINTKYRDDINKIINRASDVYYLAGRIVGEGNIKIVHFEHKK